MNKNELRAEMARYGDSNQTLAKALNRSKTSFSEKLNGHADFTQSEIAFIMQRYSLTPERIVLIFFTPLVD